MLIYVRHGATSLNSTDKSQERLRGWLPVPLAPKGLAQAKVAAKQLVKVLTSVASFETSDLHRAMQTSKIVGDAIGHKATPNPNIRDWNTGKLAGQKVEDVLDKLFFYIDHPDVPAPDGETLNTYLDRFLPLMRQKVASAGVHVVVGHARGASILEGLASKIGGKGGEVDPSFLRVRPAVQPGGILIINKHWDKSIDNPTEKD